MLSEGLKTLIPKYSMKKNMRDGYEMIETADVVLVDGILALYEVVKDETDIGVFVGAPFEVRLKRGLKRDVEGRGRNKNTVIKRFVEKVEPMFQKHVQPTKKNADYIVDNSEYVPNISLKVEDVELRGKLKEHLMEDL